MKTNVVRLLLLLSAVNGILSAQAGWRMDRFDPSRINASPATGPLSKPIFTPFITNTVGSLIRIGSDGSLILSDGHVLSSYSAGGALKWQIGFTPMADVALATNGTVYVATATATNALAGDTGQTLWPSPPPVSGPLTVGVDGTIYVGATALNPDGTIKWVSSATASVFSTDESRFYIMNTKSTPGGPIGNVASYDSATGQFVSDTPCDPRGGIYGFAPWGTLFTGSISNDFLELSETLQTCDGISTGSLAVGVTTFVGNSIIVYPRVLGQSLGASDRSGNLLWLATEQFVGGFSDAGGTLYTIAPTTNDVVALRSTDAKKYWRQTFPAGVGSMLLGDDGSLYVSSGSTLYKTAPAVLPGGTINVTTTLAAATFTISGPATYTGSGTSFTQPNASPGTYVITYGAVTGYVTPPSQTLSLSVGGMITFNGSYVSSASFGPGNITQNGSIAEPVNTATGNYYTTHSDLLVPGKGFPLAFARYYNSSDPYSGPLGSGWTHSYNIFLRQVAGLVVVKEADGHEDVFSPTGAGNYAAQTPGLFDSLRMEADGSFTLTRKNQMRFRFTSSGLLTTIVDRNGNTQALAYTGSNLTSITDISGRAFTLRYDGSNRLITLADTLGRVLHFGYDISGNLALFQNALGGTTQYAYDSHNQMTSAKDFRGNVYLQNAYDAQGRVVSQSNALDFTTTFAYDSPSTGITRITDPLGNVIQHVHDSNLRLIQIIDALGGSTSYTYSPSNLKLSTTDPLGRTQTFNYDANGNLTNAADPTGKTTQFAYNLKNSLIQVTDRLGRITRFTYDLKGNLTSVLDPAGATSAFAYDPAGSVITAKNARNFTTGFSYDDAGNLIRVTDALGGTVQMTYDAAGRLLSVKNQLGKTETRAYDLNNRLLTMADPLGNATHFAYDPNGNLTQITDANNKITQYFYDPTNKLTQVSDAVGGVTRYMYNGNTDLTSVIDANNHTTAYAYDALRRLTSSTDPLGRQKHYSYDAVGNITGTLDGNFKVNTFAYDTLNRLTSIFLSDGKTVSYSYDAVGNRLTMNDWRGSSSYLYDALNRALSFTTPDGKTVGYQYDVVGNRVKLNYPDGKTVQSEYDALNRLSEVADWSGKETTYTYDAASSLTKMTYPNGAVSLYTYDSANRLIAILNLSGFRPLSGFSYALDRVGNRTAVISIAGGRSQYGYDGLYRLTSWTEPVGRVTHYSYDAVGNRLSLAAPSGTTNYTYDAADQLLKAGPTTFAYDGNGSQITKTTGAGTATYSWDALNRLISLTGAGLNTQYQYDGNGNRVGQQIGANAYQYLSDTATALPVELNENGPDGNINYVYGQSLISATSPAFQSFYQFDGLGSVSNVTNQTGTLTANYAYDPWGQAATPVAPPFRLDTLGTKNRYKFTGEAADPNDGLLFLRARYYDPQTGRFLNPDPLNMSLHSYVYALDSPLQFVDPSGLFSIDPLLGRAETTAELVITVSTEAGTHLMSSAEPVSAGVWSFARDNAARAGLRLVGNIASYGSVAYGLYQDSYNQALTLGQRASKTLVNIATLAPTPWAVGLSVELGVLSLIDPAGTEAVKARLFSILKVGGGVEALDPQSRCLIDPQACAARVAIPGQIQK